MRNWLRRSIGFTLIELLIVVAIIAILAAIAVPNFLEAQVRSKIGRAKADMRSIATALESYCVDTGKYPIDGSWGFLHASQNGKVPSHLEQLTTPIAYMTTMPREAFARKSIGFWYPAGGPDFYGWSGPYDFVPNTILFQGLNGLSLVPHAKWALSSIGPDMLGGGGANLIFGMEYALTRPQTPPKNTWGGGYETIYDPTNGTISSGDIPRLGP